jgi:hypothetical protein
VTTTFAIRDSMLTAVFMPCLDDPDLVVDDHTTNLIQFPRTEPIVPCECHGGQPELGVLPVVPHVNVHGLVAVKTVEEEPVRPRNPRNPRHVESRSE